MKLMMTTPHFIFSIFLFFLFFSCIEPQKTIYGVNLGGWLMLEKWITPSLFPSDSRIVDEWTFCQYLGHDKAKSALTTHWENWVTENDLAMLSSAGGFSHFFLRLSISSSHSSSYSYRLLDTLNTSRS